MAIRTGLIAEYLFDDGADDTSGSGCDGVICGAVPTADRFGRANHAYHFDGVDDYVEVTPPPSFTVDALSVSVWVRYDARDFSEWTNCIVAIDDGDDEDQSRRVFQLSTYWGHVVWHRMCDARDPMCRQRVRPGVWQHLVAVHEQGVNRLYLDGELHDTTPHPLRVHAAQPMHIGRKGTPEAYFFFKGAIDDVRIYSRALGRDDVVELFHEGGWQPPALETTDADANRLSGRWGQHGVVFLDLAEDGRGRVTGQIMSGRPGNMAAVSNGTFDRRTGALRLQGTARDPRQNDVAPFLIEGRLDRGEITVTANFKDFSGNFILTREAARLRWSRRSIRSHLDALMFRLRGRRTRPSPT